MFGEFDHVGFLVRDLDAAVARAQRSFSLPVARTLELPQYGISAAFLGAGRGTLEIFTLEDPELRDPRLAGAEQRIDHMAFRVAELDGAGRDAARRRRALQRARSRGEVPGPLELGGMRHIWTLPESTAGLALQLIEAPAR